MKVFLCHHLVSGVSEFRSEVAGSQGSAQMGLPLCLELHVNTATELILLVKSTLTFSFDSCSALCLPPPLQPPVRTSVRNSALKTYQIT